jgi:hypothetical protein
MACGINDTLLAGAFDNLNCYARAQFEAACCIDGSSVIPGCEGAIQWAGHGQFLAYFRNATYIFYSLMVILFGLIVLWQLGWNVLGCCGWNSESGGMWAGMTTVPILNRRYWGWSVFGLYAVSAAIGVALYMLIAPKNTTGQYLKWHGSPNAAYSTMLTLSLLLFTFGVICLLMPFRRIHHTHFTLIKGLWLILSGAMVLTLAWPIPDESRARVQTIGAILWVAAGVWAILTVPLLRWRYGEYAYADETILDVYSVPVSSNDITFRKSIRYKDTLKPMATSIVWFDGLNAVLVSTMAAVGAGLQIDLKADEHLWPHWIQKDCSTAGPLYWTFILIVVLCGLVLLWALWVCISSWCQTTITYTQEQIQWVTRRNQDGQFFCMSEIPSDCSVDCSVDPSTGIQTCSSGKMGGGGSGGGVGGW